MTNIYLLFCAIIFSLTASLADTKTATMDKEAVRQVMRSNISNFQKCYSDELKNDKTLNGKIIIKWNISDEGLVTKALIESSKMNSSIVENCIIEVVKTLKFPKAPKGIVGEVLYPFNFQSSK